MPSPELAVECPRCGNRETDWVADLNEEYQEVECSSCRALLGVAYRVSAEATVESVEVDSTPFLECECLRCESVVQLDDIEEESGTAGVQCPECRSLLEVRWSDWGTELEPKFVEGPERP